VVTNGAESASVGRELNRIGFHTKHAKEFLQMGLPYSEDLLGELQQILNIAHKAVAKAEWDVRRAESMDAPLTPTFFFDDIGEEEAAPGEDGAPAEHLGAEVPAYNHTGL